MIANSKTQSNILINKLALTVLTEEKLTNYRINILDVKIKIRL